MAREMDNLISAVGGGIGAALTSDPKDTSNAQKRQAALSAAETDVEVEDIEAQGQQDRATGGATGPMPTGQIVPYGPEDAAGNPNIAMASGLSSAEIVDGIHTGEPVALEQFYITQDDMGRSIVKFRDDSGQEQQWVVSAAQALGMMDTRRVNRHKMAEYNAQQQELQEAREDNQGAFERGITMLDDGSNPMLSAVLKDMYNDDPTGTLKWMYDIQYLEAKDADAAAAEKFQIVNNAMSDQSRAMVAETSGTYENHFGNQYGEYQNLLEKDPNNPQIRGALQQLESIVGIFKQGMGFTPYPGMDMSLSPGQAQQSPGMTEKMYRTWIEMLSIGVPTADMNQHRYTVNNPQDPDAWESEGENLVMHLQWLAGQLGWQGRITDPLTGMPHIQDEAAIRKAFAQVFNNPAVLLANQASAPTLSSQGTPYLGSAPTQQPQLTPPPGSIGAQQQQAPPQSQIDPGRSAAPFGDPLELQIESDTRAVKATGKAALDKARVEDLEIKEINEKVELLLNKKSPARLKADGLVVEMGIKNVESQLKVLDAMLEMYGKLEPGKEKETLLQVMIVLSEEVKPEVFAKAREAIKAAEEDKDK